MLNKSKSKLGWIGFIVIGVMLFGMQDFIVDCAWAQDLFRSVTPCRIVDTRLPGPVSGIFAPNEIRDFFVFGTTQVSDQGGNPAGCPSPLGEPAAVHINVAVVPQSGTGNIGVFPRAAPTPKASLVNYKTGVQNIANAATIKTFNGELEDISVINRFGFAHVVIDVMGYWYLSTPPPPPPPPPPPSP